jgi:hypothetical protein
MQVRKISNADASQMQVNLQGTCRELAGNLQTSSKKFPYNIWELVRIEKDLEIQS